MIQISTVVSSTFGTILCPIRGLYSRLVISDGLRLEITLTGYLVNLVGHLQGQEASGQNLDASSVNLTPFPAKVIWLYDPGSSEPFFLLRLYRAFRPWC